MTPTFLPAQYPSFNRRGCESNLFEVFSDLVSKALHLGGLDGFGSPKAEDLSLPEQMLQPLYYYAKGGYSHCQITVTVVLLI